MRFGNDTFGGKHEIIWDPETIDINGDGKQKITIKIVQDNNKSKIVDIKGNHELHGIPLFGGEHDFIWRPENINISWDGKQEIVLIAVVKDNDKERIVDIKGSNKLHGIPLFGGEHDWIDHFFYTIDKDEGGKPDMPIIKVKNNGKSKIVEIKGNSLFSGEYEQIFRLFTIDTEGNGKKDTLVMIVKDHGKDKIVDIKGSNKLHGIPLFGGEYNQILSLMMVEIDEDGKPNRLVAHVWNNGESKIVDIKGNNLFSGEDGIIKFLTLCKTSKDIYRNLDYWGREGPYNGGLLQQKIKRELACIGRYCDYGK